MQVFEGYLGTLFFFPRAFCFWFLLHLGINKLPGGPCLNGGAGDEKQYISWMCACLKEVHNMLTSLIQCRSYTQRSSIRNLVDLCLKLSKWWPYTLFLCHVVSERLIQMGQSGMLRKFLHIVCADLCSKFQLLRFFSCTFAGPGIILSLEAVH